MNFPGWKFSTVRIFWMNPVNFKSVEKNSPYSVRDLTFYIKHRLETDSELQDVEVEGEISNLTRHGSGHIYFSLKDQEAQINCAMWRATAQHYAGKLPRHGEKVRVRGHISVYPPRGSYQFIVRALRKAGQGDLHQKFLALRDRLKEEGLFEPDRKQRPPRIPRKIGVITSPTGSVIRDVLDTIQRRFPHVEVLVVPTPVQGAGAAPVIARNLKRLGQQPGLDVVLLVRGGGSLEDLWCFNEEEVARAIVSCPVPVISGVGHETDTTIADFVADRRAATPTAAAELAVPVAADLKAFLDDSEQRFRSRLQQFIDLRRQMLDDYAGRLRHRLQNHVDFRRQRVDAYADRLVGLMNAETRTVRGKLDELSQLMRMGVERSLSETRRSLDQQEERLEGLALGQFGPLRQELEKLELGLMSLDMRKVLERGYSVTLKDGKMVQDAGELAIGEQIETVLGKGRLVSTVDTVSTSNEEQ